MACETLLLARSLIFCLFNFAWCAIEPVQSRKTFLNRFKMLLETSLMAFDSSWSRLLGLRLMPSVISGSSVAIPG